MTSMEAPNSTRDYDTVATNRLLILEAINDWSGRALLEGGAVKLTFGGDDPCCATEDELSELTSVMHSQPVIFYPTTNFSLSNDQQISFNRLGTSYRILPHVSHSRSDAIGIAEAKHIKDVDSALQLWSFCATEDCFRYLEYQIENHNLYLEGDEYSTTRRIITSYLQNNLSISVIRCGIWRAVKQAAALSTQQFFNTEKASRTIPKKIDKALSALASDENPPIYDRIGYTPMGAVLTLFQNRFAIDDLTNGFQARQKLAADASLAPPPKKQKTTQAHGHAVKGNLYYLADFTEFDRKLLSLFEDLITETAEPEWDNDHLIGKLSFSMNDYYGLKIREFAQELYAHLKVSPPTQEDIQKYIDAAPGTETTSLEKEWFATGKAIEACLISGGVSQARVSDVASVIQFPASICDLVNIISETRFNSGLVASRSNHSYISNEFLETLSEISIWKHRFAIPEYILFPTWDDSTLIKAVINDETEKLAEIVTGSFMKIMTYYSKPDIKLLNLVSKKLSYAAAAFSDANPTD